MTRHPLPQVLQRFGPAGWLVVLLLTWSTVISQAAAPVCSYRIVASYNHDEAAFTQGLVYTGGVLFEGTGLLGQSSLRRVDLQTGEVLQITELAYEYFGEGIAVRGDEIIQLTYRREVGFVYDRTSFTAVDQFSFTGQGWGLTYDGSRLIMSDGTAYLRFWDPDSFAELGRVQVSDDQRPVIRLNELEAIAGEVFANVWGSDRIARIDPRTGEVRAWIDLTGLLASQGISPSPGVLNGIAYDAEHDRLLITGKRWPLLFEIDMVGCPPLLLFADSFESGDISGWSIPGS